MKVFVVIEMPKIEQALKLAAHVKNFKYIQEAQTASSYTIEKIKSFVLENNGQILMILPTKLIIQLHPMHLDALEKVISGYQESLNTIIAVGIGEDYEHANLAVKKSHKSHEFEFWHPETDGRNEEEKPLNQIADKIPEEKQNPVAMPSLEEELNTKEQFFQALAQQQLAQMQPQMPQQPSPEEQAAMQANGGPQEEQQEEIDPREAMMPEQMAEPEAKAEEVETTEMDASKDEEAADDAHHAKIRERLEGLLATIHQHMPEMAKLAEKNPESFKLAMKMMDASLKMAKAYREGQFPELKKSGGLPKFRRSFFKLVPDIVRDGKISVKDPTTGKISWRGVRTGLMQGPQGEPLSTRTHNEISAGNELGKDEIKGGLADKKKPSDFDKDQLKAGVKVEMEHTDNPKIAMEIAMDHLTEDKDYYKKLAIMESTNKSEILQKPYVSEAQRKWAHTNAGEKALGGKKAVAHWDSETKGRKLPEKVSKEELEKAPQPYMAETNDDDVDEDDLDYVPTRTEEFSHPLNEPTRAHKKIHEAKLPNGLIHRIFAEREPGANGEELLHTLYHPLHKKPLASLGIASEPYDLEDGIDLDDEGSNIFTVKNSGVNPKFRGKSLGKQLYRAALMHHRKLRSDSLVSPAAHKVWEDLSSKPEFDVQLEDYNEYNEEPHSASYVGDGKPSKKLFPNVKLDAGKKQALKPTKKIKKPQRLAASEKKLTKNEYFASLKKMSRPRVAFPKLEGQGVHSRPDQEVSIIDTPRQKEIYARKMINDRKTPFKLQAEREHEVKRVKPKSNKTAATGMHRNYLHDKSKQKKGFAYVLSSDLKNKKTANDKRAQQLSDVVTNKTPEQIQERNNKELVDSSKKLDSTTNHEATHYSLGQIMHRYGEQGESKVIAHLLDQAFPKGDKEAQTAKAILFDYVGKGRGYRSNKAEEMITHLRDILTNESSRRDFNIHNHMNNRKDTRPYLQYYKKALNRMVHAAKQIGPEFFDGEG